MKRLIQRAIPLLLAMILTVGMVPAALAADGTPVHGFTDVHATDYYADAVAWAADQGVTSGTSETTFSPHDTVTRAQAVTFLWRAAGSPQPERASSPFVDVSSGDYYYIPVLWAAEEGITGGVSADRFGPEQTLAYDQIFTFISKLAGESGTGADWSEAAVNWAEESGLTDGLSFTAKGACPRSDVVYCLWRQVGGGETPQPVDQEEDPADPEQPGLPDEVGATLAITTGYLDRKSAIDISAFNLEASQAEALAQEIADMDGEDPYGVTHVNAYEQDGQIAKTLAVYYTTSQISITTTAASDWRYVSDAALEEAEQVVDEVVTAGMSDYDIVKALHDYLVTHCDYDQRLYSGSMPFLSHQAEGALLEGAAVCSGYAKAYEALLDAAGIPCETITGYANGYHAWNLVQVDGEWYHVDTTWDDPTNRGGDYVRYDYFLKSDDYMLDNRHSRWTADRTCTSTLYDGELLDSEEQEQQEILDEILALCFDAIQDFPYQTESELQAATVEELRGAYYGYIDFSGSGIDPSLLSLYYGRGYVTEAIRERYPDYLLTGFDSANLRYEIRRFDTSEEVTRRQEAQREEQEEQQAQQDAENAAAAAQIQAVLEQAVADMDCESTTITLTGYTDDAIKQACKNMCTDGYSFGDYTYSLPAINADYSVSAQSGGVVKLTNKKWAEAELQRYVEQIEEAIDDGEFSVKLLPGNYPDQDGSHYAFNAYNRVRKDGYTTASGKVSGEDYVLFSGGSNKDTDVFSASIQYPLPVMDEEEAQSYYIGLIEDAIRNRETEVQFQYKFGDQDYSDAAYAAQRAVTSSGYEVDSLVYWTDYRLSLGTNSYSGIMTITIQYQQAPAAPQGG